MIPGLSVQLLANSGKQQFTVPYDTEIAYSLNRPVSFCDYPDKNGNEAFLLGDSSPFR
jgi:hypothetical protein